MPPHILVKRNIYTQILKDGGLVSVVKGCKRLTHRDIEQVCWQRVPTYGMTR
jgi:hypothetical protein